MSQISQVCFGSAALFFTLTFFISDRAMKTATCIWMAALLVKGIANV